MKQIKSLFCGLGLTLLTAVSIAVVSSNQGVNLNFTNASTPYGCSLPAGYHELADALALTNSSVANPYSLRGTVTRSENGVTYLQRVNQTSQELDSIKLTNSSSYTPGNVLDISGGTLGKDSNDVPYLNLTGASVSVGYVSNPTGFEPIVYNDISTFTNNAFIRDTYNYSHFVEIDNVVVSFVSDSNYVATLSSSTNAELRMKVLADSSSIASALDNYHYQDSVLNIKGVLDRFNDEDILKVVKVSDIEVASSPLRNVQDTTIFHAFNWSIASILNQLETIRDNGFKTIQMSPLQPHKDYGSTTTMNEWWALYQPYGLMVSNLDNQSRLGKTSDLITLTQRAKEMGINVIMDVVVNHLAQGSYNSFNASTQVFEPTIYNNNLLHGLSDSAYQDGNTQAIVRGTPGGMPDLKTEDSRVQERVIDMLKTYIDCGVVGFRFDAAKHIETPDDGQYSSNFWPNVLGAATSYAQSKGFTPYYYGEVLSPGNYRSWSSYTNYMSVTSSYSSQLVREGINSGNLNTITADYIGGVSSNKIVQWAESHDNYAGQAHESTYISQSNIDKVYAIQASRSNAATVYLARPTSMNDSIGSYSTAYNNPVIKAVNRFHNELVDASEYIKKNNGYYMNVRLSNERAGAVIVNVSNNNPSTIDLNVDGGFMIPDGKYTELISGTEVTVSQGKVTQHFSANGVMVLLRDMKEKYGLMVNTTPISAVKTGDRDGFTQYKITAHKFHAGEHVTLYDYEYGSQWVVNIDPASFDGDATYLSKVGNSYYNVLKDFTADVYIKLKYQEDQIYFGLTSLSIDKDYLDLDIDESDTVIVSNASGAINVTSSNDNIATARKEGTSIIITGVGKGTATITISDNEKSKTVTVDVDKNEVTLYFTNNQYWSNVYCYYWGASGNNDWPGTKLTKVKTNDYGEDIYSVTIDLDTYNMAIFNNGSGTQTVDISLTGNVITQCGLYPSSKNNEGKWNIGIYQYSD